MYSYPNFIPLDRAGVRRIVSVLAPFSFTRLYGAWPNFAVQADAKQLPCRSAERYLRALGELTSRVSSSLSRLSRQASYSTLGAERRSGTVWEEICCRTLNPSRRQGWSRHYVAKHRLPQLRIAFVRDDDHIVQHLARI